MRPVLLRMDGFAAFREPTVVDFREADYFVLVGPTGSGKSTVIDAMTFALYGSVPRWDDDRAVGMALAPTAGRGTVSLVFDLGGERYVVTRALRRTASTGAVTVKEARLERLADPAGTGEPDEETVPLADGARQVSKQAEELLGLPFEDFCTCVVLPQGDFADFLHAKAGDRQKKLERILGLGVYEQIMRRANAEAATAQQRADLLGEQLGRYADATAETERAAGARVQALEALATRVDEAAPRLAEAGAALVAAEAAETRVRDERALLAGLVAPEGVAALDERRRRSAEALQRARTRAGEAEDADTAARDRRDAAPDRARLEQVRRDHAELARIETELPGARERAAAARDAYATAAGSAAAARAAVDDARKAADAAADTHAATQDTLRRIGEERDALGAVVLPAGLDALEGRRSTAARALDVAAGTLTDAERAEVDARRAVEAAPAREPLEQARRDHRALAEARGEQQAADARRAAAEQDAAAADARLSRARRELDDARERQARADRSDVAAVLRPTLVEGGHCPVCAQTVPTLPDPLPAGDADAARTALAEAEAEHERVREARGTAAAALAAARADGDRAATAVTRLVQALDGFPGPSGVDDRLAELDRLAQGVQDADAAARTARRERDTAAERLESVRDELDAARSQLRSAREPLVRRGLDAPAPDGDDVAAGWRALVDWARSEAGSREAAAAQARDAAAAASWDRDTTARDLAEAETTATARHRDETVAARTEQETAGAVATAQRRAGELRDALAGAPGADEADAQLQRVAELEEQARAAGVALREARTALRAAEEDAAGGEREVAAAWDALRRARDPLVGLGAPMPEGDDLAAAWSALTRWTAGEATARDTDLAAARAEVERALQARDALVARLADDLAAHDVEAGGDPAPAAAAAVAGAAQAARGDRARIVERREAAAGLLAEQAEAQDAQQVARLLGQQLRSDHFPRWLVASALDALVVDASASLADLSGGQFALTHDRGEFQVVDHADADSRRPVKTLSGGETFQASLALALALSSQLSGLAAQGAPRLESIFLDEGFGTLDEANLEIVASTLENLAVHGDRMVGVITHVAALAERIPVRFVLRRDQRGSSVVREGP